jgi:hypothetical protein
MMVPYDNDKGRQGHPFFLASSPATNTLSNTNSVRAELFVQSQIQQQLLSPASRSRNGSFQYHSLSPSLQHQAELQPYMSMSSTPQSATLHNSFSGYGVDMQRGGSYGSMASQSQYSEVSSGQHSGYGQPRSPFSAVDHGQQHSPFNVLHDVVSKFGRPRSVSQGLNSSLYPYFDTGIGRDPILFDYPQPTNISTNDLSFGSQHSPGATIDKPMFAHDVNLFTKADNMPMLL